MVGQKGASEALEDAAHLLMDQALILEGEPVPDPSAFTKRLSGLVSHPRSRNDRALCTPSGAAPQLSSSQTKSAPMMRPLPCFS